VSSDCRCGSGGVGCSNRLPLALSSRAVGVDYFDIVNSYAPTPASAALVRDSEPRRRLFVTRRYRWRRMHQRFARLTAISLNPVYLNIRRSCWARCPVRAPLAVCVHNAEVVFCMLIQVFSSNPVTTRCRFAGQRDIAFEDLVGVSSDFYIWTVAVKRLDPMRKPWAAVVGIVAVVATTRALVWSWSHDTCLIAVDIVGPRPTGATPGPFRAVSGQIFCRRCGSAPPDHGTLDGTREYSNLFLPSIYSIHPRLAITQRATPDRSFSIPPNSSPLAVKMLATASA
jgi:hypothetical protein